MATFRNFVLLSCRSLSHSHHCHISQFKPIQLPKFQYSTTQIRFNAPRKSFLASILDNIKQEMEKDKQLKESLEKFKMDSKKLDDSDALKKAREKYEKIEKGTSEVSSDFKSKLKEAAEMASEAASKARERASESIEQTKYLKSAKETLSKSSEYLKKSRESLGETFESNRSTFESLGERIKTVKSAVDLIASTEDIMYVKPDVLLKRTDLAMLKKEEKEYAPDSESMGIELHKDAKWKAQWQEFKDNNEVMNKMFEYKQKFDESDNVAVRTTRALTEKLGSVFGRMAAPNEVSLALTEVAKIDPTFDKDNFIRFVQKIMIPHCLEAVARQDLEVIKDWCSEPLYNMLKQNFERIQHTGCKLCIDILDVSHVELFTAQIIDKKPVIIVIFNAQEISYAVDAKGEVVEGANDKVFRVQYVWAISRDQEDLDPFTAWRLMELSSTKSELAF